MEKLGKKEFSAIIKLRSKEEKVAPPKDAELLAAFDLAVPRGKGGVDEAGFLRFGALVKRGDVPGIGQAVLIEKPTEEDVALLALLDKTESETIKALFREIRSIAPKKGDGAERLSKKELSAFVKSRAKEQKLALPRDKDLAHMFDLADPRGKGGVDEAGFLRFGALVKQGKVSSADFSFFVPSAGAQSASFTDLNAENRAELLKNLMVSYYAENPTYGLTESGSDAAIYVRDQVMVRRYCFIFGIVQIQIGTHLLPAWFQVSCLLELFSVSDRAEAMQALPTGMAAAALSELRLRGNFEDVLACMGRGAQAAVSQVLASGGNVKEVRHLHECSIIFKALDDNRIIVFRPVVGCCAECSQGTQEASPGRHWGPTCWLFEQPRCWLIAVEDKSRLFRAAH